MQTTKMEWSRTILFLGGMISILVSGYTLESTNNMSAAYVLLLLACVLLATSVVVDVFVIERMRKK